MKQQIRIPTATATMMFYGYQSVKAAIEYFRAAYADPNCPYPVSGTLKNVNAQLQLSLGIIDRRIPLEKRDDFENQVKKIDGLQIDNILAIYAKLTPEKQNLLENAAEELMKSDCVGNLKVGL